MEAISCHCQDQITSDQPMDEHLVKVRIARVFKSNVFIGLNVSGYGMLILTRVVSPEFSVLNHKHWHALAFVDYTCCYYTGNDINEPFLTMCARG